MGRFWIFFLRQSASQVALSAILSLGAGISATCLLALINAVLLHPDRMIDRNTILSFAGLCLVRLAAGVAAGYVLVRLSQWALYRLRLDICARILSADQALLEQVGNHRLHAALNEDVREISNTVTNIPYFLTNAAIIVTSILYLFWKSPIIAAGCIVCMSIGMCTFWIPMLVARQHLKEAREIQDDLFKCFKGITDGHKELKQNAIKRVEFVDRLLQPTARGFSKATIRGTTIYTGASNWNRLLFFVYVALLLFVVPRWTGILSTEIAGYLLVILYIMGPVEAIMNALPGVSRAGVAVEKLQRLGFTLGQRQEPATSTQPTGTPPRITIEDVKYQYLPEEGAAPFHIGPISLEIVPGELIFVIGGNGSGKTTLAKVLCGLYVPDSGRILVDGKPVHQADMEEYRQLFGVVFSDYFLFDRLLGVADEELKQKAQAYLKLLQLDSKVSINDGRLSTTKLSAGQRKRLALLAAYIEDRPCLIFDEWAADQDPAFKRVFYHRLLPELRSAGKCVVIITHDEHYFDVADRIVRLSEGTLFPGEPSAATEAGVLAL